MNCQLARTNTYLSGQLKIDLTLNKNKGDLCVEDVHLSPVSNYTGFGWGDDPDDLLDGRHIENIKNFYSKTSNIFYEECLNPALVSEYPIYSPNFVADTHNNDNKMGLYRVPIRTYGKPYAFFCPFWITEPSKFLGTRFKFTFYKYSNINPLNDYIAEAEAETNAEEYPSEKTKISSIYLSMSDLDDRITHNKFVKYFNDYLNGFSSHEYDIKTDKFLTSNVVSNAFKLNIDTDLSNVNIISDNNSITQNASDISIKKAIKFKPTGTLSSNTAAGVLTDAQIEQKSTSIEKEIAEPFLSDDLVYISLKDGKGWVKGIDPQAGTYVNKDISYLCNTLLEKERPLMDNDYYLARIFKDNSMIAQQLINFNFLFDIADIIPHVVYEELQYCRFGIEVEIEQPDENGGYETLQLKDFYSNYEFIPNAYIVRESNSLKITYDKSSIGSSYISLIDAKYSENILDYKKNSDYIQYAYKNKLEQNIVHWSIGDSKYIFNFYDGFTPIVVDKQVNYSNASVVYKSSGDMGFSPNIAINQFSASQQTPLWAKNVTLGIPSTELRENYQKYYTGFNISNEWIEGVKYDFSNIDYNSILTDLAKLGITEIDVNTINDYLSGNIWVKLLPIIIPGTDENDIQVDVQKYGDLIFITVSEDIKYLSFVNVMRRLKSLLYPSGFIPLDIAAAQYVEDKPIELSQASSTKLTRQPESAVRFAGVNNLFKQTERARTNELVAPVVETLNPDDPDTINPVMNGIINHYPQNLPGGTQLQKRGFKYYINNDEHTDALQQPSGREAIPTMLRYELNNIEYEDVIEYKACAQYGTSQSDPYMIEFCGDTVQFKVLSTEQKNTIIGEYFLYWFMNHAVMPSSISFDRGYNAKIAESPSNDSTEVDFVMSSQNMLEKTTLYRYDGNLQPLFITVDDKTDDKNPEKNLVNYSNYIIQYEESLQSIPAFNAYSNTKYSPEYPSIGYSSMASEVIDYDHSAPIQYYGDKSCNIYRGERRWYNGSFMYFLPRKIQLSIISTNYDENEIFSGFVNEILTNMDLLEPELTATTSLEDIQEYMRNNVDFVMNYILPLYNYDSRCNIKYRDDVDVDNQPELDENHQIKYVYDVTFELI